MSGGIKCVRNGCEYSGKECEFWNECLGFEPEKRDKPQSGQMSIPRPTEEQVQEVVVEFCRLMRIECVHIPNEGKRSVSYGAKLKEMGMQKGFPDLFIPNARHGYHGLLIELKRDRNSYPTKEQRDWIKHLSREGYYAVVAYGADEAIAIIKKYTGIR